MKKLRFYVLIILGLLSLASCGGSSGGGGSSSSGGSTTTTGSIVSSPIIYLPNSSTNSATILTYNNKSSSLTLTSATLNGSELYPVSETSLSSMLNITNCETISANSYCSILIESTANPEDLSLAMTFTDESGNTYTTNQSIVYTSQSYDSDGFYILGATSSTLNAYVAPKSTTATSLSFILSSSFQSGSLSVSSTNSNVTSSSVTCSSYQSGGICIATITINNSTNGIESSGQTTVGLTISGEAATTSSQSLKKSMINTYSTTSSLSLTISVTYAPNLVISPTNATISPADGESTQQIVVANSGNESAILGLITAATPVEVTNSTCGNGTLILAGSTCTFDITADSTSSGNSNILIPYYDASGTVYSNGQVYVTYIGTTPGPNESFITGDGSLTYVVVGETASLNMIVTNSGTVTLSSITFADDDLPSGMTFGDYGTSSSCRIDGTESLTAGASCTLTINYEPTAEASGTFLLSNTANYTDTDGSTYSWASPVTTLSYSAIDGVAILQIAPSTVSMSIPANGESTVAESFTVTNYGQISTTITSESMPTYLDESSSTCLNTTLAVGDSCIIKTTFGPKSTTLSSSGNLSVTYAATPNSQSTQAFSTVSMASSLAALIQLTSIVEAGIYSGSTNTYSFTNTPLTPFRVMIVYTNNGTTTASNFTTQGPLESGWYVYSSSTTCPYNSSSGSLTSGESCVLAVAAVESTAILAGKGAYNYAGALYLGLPGYSYYDSATGVNVNTDPTYSSYGSTWYVTATIFASVSSGSVVTGSGFSSAHSIVTTFTLNGTTDTFPLTITTSIPTSSGTSSIYTSSNTCTISADDGTCTITITSDAGTSLTTYTYPYVVSPSGSTLGIESSFSFTLQ